MRRVIDSGKATWWRCVCGVEYRVERASDRCPNCGSTDGEPFDAPADYKPNSKPSANTVSVRIGESLPTEFRLLRFGTNRASSGLVRLDLGSMVSIARASRIPGIQLPAELESMQVQMKEGGGELWATEVQWSSAGVAKLKGRGGVMTLALDCDPKSGEVTAIRSVGIEAASKVGSKIGSTAPTVSSPGKPGLSERELRICREVGCDPAKFAEIKAAKGAARK